MHGATCKVGPPPGDAWGLKSEEEGTGQGRDCCCDPLRSHRSPPGEAPRGPELWHRPGARKAGNSLKGKGYLAPEADGVRGNGFVHAHEEGPETTVILGSGPSNSQNQTKQLVMRTSSI